MHSLVKVLGLGFQRDIVEELGASQVKNPPQGETKQHENKLAHIKSHFSEPIFNRLSRYYLNDTPAAKSFVEAFQEFEQSSNFENLKVAYRCILPIAISRFDDPVRLSRTFVRLSNTSQLVEGKHNFENVEKFLRGFLHNDWNIIDSIENLVSTFEINSDPLLLAEAAKASMFFTGSFRQTVPFTSEFAFRKAQPGEVKLCSKVLNHYIDKSWPDDNPFMDLSLLLDTTRWLSAHREQVEAFSYAEDRINHLIREGVKVDSTVHFLVGQLQQEEGNDAICQTLQLLLSESDPRERSNQVRRLEASLKGKVMPVFTPEDEETKELFSRQQDVFNDVLVAFNNYITTSQELQLLSQELRPGDSFAPSMFARFALSISDNPEYLFNTDFDRGPGAGVRIANVEMANAFDCDPDQADFLARYHEQWQWAGPELEYFGLSEFTLTEQCLVASNRHQRFNLLLPRTEKSIKPKIANYSIVYYADSAEMRGKPLAFLVATDVIDLIFADSFYSIEDAPPNNLKDISLKSLNPDYLYSISKSLDLPIINIGSGSNLTGFDGGLEPNSKVLHQWEQPFNDGFGVIWDSHRNFAGHVDKRFLRTKGDNFLSAEQKQEIDSELFCFHQQIKHVVSQFNIQKQLLLLRYAAYKQGTIITKMGDEEREAFGDVPSGYDTLRMPVEALRIHNNLKEQQAPEKDYPIIAFYPVGNFSKEQISAISIDTYSLSINRGGEFLAQIPTSSGSNSDFINAVTSKNNLCLNWQALIRPDLGGLMPVLFNRDKFLRNN